MENRDDSREERIQRCIQSLVFACRCRNENCLLPPCHKMKRVINHTKICKRKVKGDCRTCKELIALCCYHAKFCQVTLCSIPFCNSIKQKLPRVQERLRRRSVIRSSQAPGAA